MTDYKFNIGDTVRRFKGTTGTYGTPIGTEFVISVCGQNGLGIWYAAESYLTGWGGVYEKDLELVTSVSIPSKPSETEVEVYTRAESHDVVYGAYVPAGSMVDVTLPDGATARGALTISRDGTLHVTTPSNESVQADDRTIKVGDRVRSLRRWQHGLVGTVEAVDATSIIPYKVQLEGDVITYLSVLEIELID